MSTRDILIVILIAVLGVTGVLWFRANFDQETNKVMVGFRGEAQRNPWLAAERLLDRMHLAASDLREYDGLRKLQPDSVLVLPQGRQMLSESLRAGIVDWVQSGGFLVIEAEHPSIRDSLIDEFGVKRVEDADNSKANEHRQGASGISRNNGELDVNANHIDRDSLDLTVVKLPGSVLTSLVWMEADFSLVSERAWFRAGTDYSANILMLREGDGNVVVVNDLETRALCSEIGTGDFLYQPGPAFVDEMAAHARLGTDIGRSIGRALVVMEKHPAVWPGRPRSGARKTPSARSSTCKRAFSLGKRARRTSARSVT